MHGGDPEVASGSVGRVIWNAICIPRKVSKPLVSGCGSGLDGTCPPPPHKVCKHTGSWIV